MLALQTAPSTASDAYQRLVPHERTILQLLSIVYEPVHASTLSGLLQGVGYSKAGALSIEPLLRKFEHCGLLLNTDKHVRIEPSVAEIATRDAVRSGQFDKMAKLVVTRFEIDFRRLRVRTFWAGMQAFRVALYRNQRDPALQAYHHCLQHAQEEPFALVCNRPFDAAFMDTMHPDIAAVAVERILSYSYTTLESADALLNWAVARLGSGDMPRTRPHLIEHLLWHGRLQEAERLIEGSPPDEVFAARALMAATSGDTDAALRCYGQYLSKRAPGRAKKPYLMGDPYGLFYVVSLLRSTDAAHWKTAAAYLEQLKRETRQRPPQTYHVLGGALAFRSSGTWAKDGDLPLYRHPMTFLFTALDAHWRGRPRSETLEQQLEEMILMSREAAMTWFYDQFTAVRARLQAEPAPPLAGFLVDLIEVVEPWQAALNALVRLREAPASNQGDARLIWQLTMLANGRVSLQPIEQKSKGSGWTKGRAVAVKRLHDGTPPLECLTDADRAVARCIEAHRYGYYEVTHEINVERALPALIGHPLLFSFDSGEPVQLLQGEPRMLIERDGTCVRLRLSPPAAADGYAVVAETPTRWRLIQFNARHRALAQIVGEGLRVPAHAAEQIGQAVAAIAGRITVQSDVELDADHCRQVAADPRLHVYLHPFEAGLRAQVLVHPLGEAGPALLPASGGGSVVAQVGGTRLRTIRDLDHERQAMEELAAACQLTFDHGEAAAPSVESALEMLLGLETLPELLLVKWPQGERFKVKGHVGSQQFHVRVRRRDDWFEATGETRLADGQTVDLQRLLQALDDSPGRFIALGDGQFLALTEEFRRRLDDLRRFTDRDGDGVRFHPVRAALLDEVLSDIGGVQLDRHWKEHVRGLRDSLALQPAVPSTLQTPLRGYQVEGFQWLCRLAAWGVGACLADDMGLGKTLQALALLLARAADGASLVVAPSSVCLNWMAEAARFAPTLRLHFYAESDRVRLLAEAGAYDVVVCSWTMLGQDAAALTAMSWNTVIVDEAQAIKNMSTRRWQAAIELRSPCRVALTGTPIENHLGELWSLFHFLNPGLLGSLDDYTRRFAVPIERDRDKGARAALKKLIAPFMLRRTKSQVLEDLPPRTEMVRQVELSEAEAAFYEALRQQALGRVESGSSSGKPMLVLAEIMRLRRACCHPRLVAPQLEISSSKLRVFGHILRELLDNSHKALVFSQFTDHLAIVREYLDAEGVPYQYLDGSTPLPERKRRVDAFQAGQGDVFLISLKAGGTGLNLTAADYVIHLDPWWNPAVEDQASDRSHRIGQQRPVTIYRLVAKGTIEEKIVALHHHKRDLADSLLEGQDVGGKMTTPELLGLLQSSAL